MPLRPESKNKKTNSTKTSTTTSNSMKMTVNKAVDGSVVKKITKSMK